MITLWRFLAALPALFKLFETLEQRLEEEQKEAAVRRKVVDDVKTIHEAFNAKDPSKLNALFNSQ